MSMLSVIISPIMLSVIKLSVIMLNVVMLSVVAPFFAEVKKITLSFYSNPHILPFFQPCRSKPHSSVPSAPSTGTPAPGGTRPPATSSGGWPPWPGDPPICRTRPSGRPWATPTSTSSTQDQGDWIKS
jgi:hypothetical protein